MNTIFSYRFRNARKKSGLTLQQVADVLAVSKQMISKYEKGLSMPDSPNLIKLAALFNEKVDYFFRESIVELENVKFRKKSAYSPKKVKSLEVGILNQMEDYLTIEDVLNIKSEFVNPLEEFVILNSEDAEQAAVQLRQIWNLGNDPILSIISLLEYNQIKVIEIDKPEQDKFDGVSASVEQKYPVIAVNENFPVERKRFTLFHELGHLLLKFDESVSDKEQEALCNRFAGAMLLPKNIIFKEIGHKRTNLSINELINFQRQFGISISAMIYRLSDLSVITENKKKGFFIKQNTDSHYKELVFASRFIGDESSERFNRLVYKALSQEIISISKASALLHKSVEEVRDNLAII